MRHLTLALAVALTLAAGPVAAADVPSGPPHFPVHSLLAGKVVSVDGAAGTVTADVRVVVPNAPQTGPAAPAEAPSLQRVTIATDAATIVHLDAHPASLADLASGDDVIAAFDAPPGSSLDQIVAGPAIGISARSSPARSCRSTARRVPSRLTSASASPARHRGRQSLDRLHHRRARAMTCSA